MALDELEALADAGEHAEREHIDLQHVERVDIVLVPLDVGAVLHRRVHDRHGLVEALAGEHEAADMLRQMAGEADQRVGEGHGQPELWVGGIEPGFADMLVGDFLAAIAPHRAGERRRHVLLEAERLADLADRHARAVVDHGRADGGALAAITLVEILDHLLAPLMLEIDVDVRRLLPLGGDEALEQQIDLGGIDGGDAQAVADGAVGGGAAALAEDALAAGIADDVVDRQEIARIVQPGDERQLLVEQRLHLFRHALGIALGCMQPGEILEMLLRRLARRHRFVGIFIAQRLQRKADALCDRERACDGLRIAREQPRHLRAAL